jgi:hypothetical protein
MKIYQHITSGVMTMAMGGVLLISACTDDIKFGDAFIEKTPGGTVTIDTVFSNAEYAKQFLTGIYALQYYGLPYSQSVNHSSSPYVGKLDALTDAYQLHWNSNTVYNSFYSGTLNSNEQPLISYSNDYVWEAVRQGWIFIENIGKVDGIATADKNNMIAQAKCLIAARYFDLFSVYGGLPIIDHAFTGSESSFSCPRATAEETVNFMVKLLDEAIPDLRWAYNGNTSDTDDTNTGRWTAAGAMALKAKILLFSASPLYNADQGYYDGTTEAEKQHLVWHGNYDAQRWQKALQACKDFFNRLSTDGFYKLMEPTDPEVNCKNDANGYRQAYRYGYIRQGSKEVLHSTRVATVYGTQGTYAWWNWVGIGRHSYLPTLEYMEMFPWSDGTPFNWEKDETAGRINGTNGRLFYQNKVGRGGAVSKIPSRDPRLYENILVNGTTEQFDWNKGTPSGNAYELWVGGYHENWDVMGPQKNAETGETEYLLQEKLTSKYSTGMGVIKYYLGEEFHRKYMHWVYLSLDEMYLMYAEALAQTGDLTGAIAQVDIVRSRVGLAGLAAKNAALNLTTDKDNLINEILRERACELGMSNNHYYDMIRYKRTDWIVKPLHGLVTYRLMQNSKGQWVRNYEPWMGTHKDNGIAEPYRFEYETFQLFNRERQQWGKDPNSTEIKKWLLFPLPVTEVNKGYGLIQNPGW